MLHFFDVLFFYFYIFYSKIVKDHDPWMATILGLGFIESIIPNAILKLILLKGYCLRLDSWIYFAITIIVVIVNYLLYIKSGRLKKLIKTQPKIRNSHRLSAIVVITFFVIVASWLFWGPIYTKYLWNQCQ